MADSVGRLRGFVHATNTRFIRLFDGMEVLSKQKIYALFFVLTFAIAAPLILSYELHGDGSRYEHKDLAIFQDRAETILEGDMIYRDTDHVTLTPPLINYLFIPAVLLGNTPLIWTLWFAFFIFTSSVILFNILVSMYDKKFALAGSIFFIVSPFSHYTTVNMMQDDAIIVSFLLLAFLFMMRKSWYKASVVFGFGAMTKVFPALCAPLAALGPTTWKGRIAVATIGLGIGVLVTLPFLVYATDEFLQFLNFYLTGKQPASGTQLSETVSNIDQRGMSFWRFLGEYVVYIPSTYLHVVFVSFIALTWVAALMKKVEMIPAFTLCILWIFIFYSKIHYGYHLMIFSLLLPWALPYPKRLASLGGLGFFLIFIHRMWRNTSIFNTIGPVQMAFASVMWVFWIYWAAIIVRNRNNDFSSPGECTSTTILVVSYFTLICFGYYALSMLRIVL